MQVREINKRRFESQQQLGESCVRRVATEITFNLAVY